ncbi:MAG: NGG1p interacting factor NIF3 [Candidatus Levybacteria bacterium RIFCSPHIGHO2_02_FULL_42_12]|nr:MAG: NGG1p interacting factor NIF3 [Candidatus Levybacteria bacterium RIFCSPHIGHO2_01_FULL_42_15]OGH33841.1 MAG: NGG1p interacting factor NIF3 [Candidatus Levybacteria bacterium RIFCSPHIGHO2_02_FULL_42_12]OGH42829.1 MAG: NGG1p interacting factor NIF3 [Candidatus Levybacteria bacterium RIFCSPLOWO2_01_FULL_42_15]
MTLQEMYDLAVEMGIKADPRGEKRVRVLLAKAKKDYKELPLKKKKYFDPESFKSPYSDSRILVGDPKTKIKKVMAGIDSDGAEPLLVDRLNHPSTGSGLGIDLLISHHPSGHALASLYEVMDVQVDMFADAGVPVNVAYALFEERKGYVKRRFGPMNHTQPVDAARLLGIPFMVLHTIWDNLGNQFMTELLRKKDCDTVGEILDVINEIPEFIEAIKGKAGPSVVSGSEKSRAGKVVVGFTGGTNPSKELYMELAKAGVGTLVEMHVPEESITELKKLHINVIDTGHMAADSIGANAYLDALEKRGIEVVPCSGLIRVKRIQSRS